MTPQEVADDLGGRWNGTGWAALCPAHDDRNPSLSIGEGADGQVLLKCHAGCDVEDIVDAAGLTMADLFPEDADEYWEARSHEDRGGFEIEAEYDYEDADGDLVFQVIRKPGREFLQRRPDGHGGWTWNIKGVERVLYRLPQVLTESAKPDGTVYVVEGEKDADTLARIGLCSTTFNGGAGKHRLTPGGIETLARVSRTVVIADDDKKGHEHAVSVFEDLQRHGANVELCTVTQGNDITEAMEEHHLPFEETLRPLDPSLPDGAELTDTEPSTSACSWAPVDLTHALQQPPLLPSRMRRSDGHALLYPGRIHWLSGEPATGKSLLMQNEAVAVMADGEDVLYVDFDSDWREVSERLLALGARWDQLVAHLHYVRPSEPLLDRSRTIARQVFVDLLGDLAGRCGLVVLDGVTDALALEGLDMNSNTDVATWIEEVPKRCARVTGAPVVLIDHVTKSQDARGRFPVGAQEKLASVDGAAFTIEAKKTPGRAVGDEPVDGELQLKLTKDRPGYLRARSAANGLIASVSVTAHPNGSTSMTVEPPDAIASDRYRGLAEAITAYVREHPGSNKKQIVKSVRGSNGDVSDTVKALEITGKIRVDRSGSAHKHFVVEDEEPV